MKLYSLYDHKAGTYSAPNLFDNDDIACRSLSAMFASKQAAEIPPVKYPTDFSLFCLGEWDVEKGLISIDKYPVCSIVEMLQNNRRNLQEIARIYASLVEAE